MLKVGEGRLYLYSVSGSSILLDLERSVGMGNTNKVMCLSGWCTFELCIHCLGVARQVTIWTFVGWIDGAYMHGLISDLNICNFSCGGGKRKKLIQIKPKILDQLEKCMWHGVADIPCVLNILAFRIKLKILDQLEKYI